MTAFVNEPIRYSGEKTQYCATWFDEKMIDYFIFPSVVIRQADGSYDTLHGVTIQPRFVWSAIAQLKSHPISVRWAPEYITQCDQEEADQHDRLYPLSTIRPSKTDPRQTTYVTWVQCGPDVQEIRLPDRYGRAIARCNKTGYITDKELKEQWKDAGPSTPSAWDNLVTTLLEDTHYNT